jgi:hypothetical protein
MRQQCVVLWGQREAEHQWQNKQQQQQQQQQQRG